MCVTQAHFTDAAIRNPEVNALIDKIDIMPFSEPNREGVEVKVILNDGQTFSEHTSTAKGDPIHKALTKKEIVEKYFQQVEFSQTVKKAQAATVMEKIESLDDVKDVSEIINLLVC
jgi:2-methylcitrate dehydratase PrpD